MTTSSACESWLHRPGDPPAVAPGKRFCVLHAAEQSDVLRVERELRQVQQTLDAFGSEETRHPDEAKDFIEPELRAFFDLELAKLGMRCGPGYRAVPGHKTPEQLDVSLSLSATSASHWSANITARRHLEREVLAVHMEIAYRGEGSGDVYDKVRQDLIGLDRSVEQGERSEVGLPWTAAILLGPAWSSRVQNVMAVAHTRYHERALKKVPIGGADWWPFVDAIVMPGVLFKKHDYFLDPTLKGHVIPGYGGLPTTEASGLQPLAVARAFLIKRVRILKGLDPPMAGRAWPASRSSALLGVPPEDGTHAAAYLVTDLDAGVDAVWHQGSAPWDDSVHAISMAVQPKPTCTKQSRYVARLR